MAKLARKERRKRGELKRLVPHPLSVEIYGVDPGSKLSDGIKENGLLEDIVVAADEITVVSGCRRREACLAAGITRVDIRVREDLIEPLDIEEAVLQYNTKAPLTREMVARELQASQRIALARSKPKANGRPPTVSDVTRQVAEEHGESYPTARRAIEVINKVDQLKEDGKTKEAAAVLETLNNKGYSQAVEKANEFVPPKRRPGTSPRTQERRAAEAQAKKGAGKSTTNVKPKVSPPKSGPSRPKMPALNASDLKRLRKAMQSLNSVTSQLPKVVYKECETYIDLTRKVMEKYEQ